MPPPAHGPRRRASAVAVDVCLYILFCCSARGSAPTRRHGGRRQPDASISSCALRHVAPVAAPILLIPTMALFSQQQQQQHRFRPQRTSSRLRSRLHLISPCRNGSLRAILRDESRALTGKQVRLNPLDWSLPHACTHSLTRSSPPARTTEHPPDWTGHA